jgi:hypothetical protein
MIAIPMQAGAGVESPVEADKRFRVYEGKPGEASCQGALRKSRAVKQTHATPLSMDVGALAGILAVGWRSFDHFHFKLYRQLFGRIAGGIVAGLVFQGPA